MKKITILFLGFISLGVFSVYAQEDTPDYGQVTGNFQIDAQLYRDDIKINALAPSDYMRANSWANFAYSLGKFTAGIRFEGYPNTLIGFPNAGGINDGLGIPIRWLNFNNDNFDITLGNFYEQFGNGLIFRSYEEKTLGLDNAMDGLKIKYNLRPGVYIKGIIGKQRYYWQYGPGLIKGLDGELQLNDMFPAFSESDFRVILGGSFVTKYQLDENPTYKLPENVGASAGRLDLRFKGFAVASEYAYKINDPSLDNNYIYKPGQAFMTNVSYSQKGLGIILGTKWVDNMSLRSNRDASLTDLTMNLLPEISKNNVYSLPAFYPYASQPNSEFGIKAEVIYKIKKETFLGGKYGTTLSANFSRVTDIEKTQINDTTPIGARGTYGYNTTFFSIGDELFYQDFNFEISKKWNKKLYTNLSYFNVFYNFNKLRGVAGHENVKANIAIADITYKITGEIAIRTEFQNMFTKQDDGNWGLGLVELTIPGWFFTLIDNWNYGNTVPENRFHYYNFGFGHIHGSSRIQISYGRTREGVMCVGGVCRNVPAANGISLSISSTF